MSGLGQKNVAIFSCYKEANIISRFALPLSGYSFLALQQFLKDPNLFTYPCSQQGPFPSRCRPGQEDDMLSAGVGASSWQGIGHCYIECFVLSNHGQEPWAAWKCVKELDVIRICARCSEREFHEKRSIDRVTSCVASQYHQCLLQIFKAGNIGN